jgi:AraC-like DNA-binding protein
MDPFGQVVELLRPRTLDRCKHMHGRGSWAIRFHDESNVVFGLVAAGSCYFDLPGSESRPLGTGDFVLMTAPSDWVLRNGAPVVPVNIERADKGSPGSVVLFGDSSSGDQFTRVIGGHFSFDPVNADLLTDLLPPVVVVRSDNDAASRLSSILRLIDDEVSSDRPARQTMLGRLLEAMLLETLRTQVGKGDVVRTGLLEGLADPKIALALRAVHADVQRGWTVGTLANCAGMSRSAFAERFSQRVGVTPIEYLLKWRMALAKDALRFSGRSLSEIALAIGYGSSSAFSTAFSRVVGCPPGQYAIERR